MRQGIRGTGYVQRSSLLGGQISARARSCVKDCEAKDELNHTLCSIKAFSQNNDKATESERVTV
eukprot:624775-Rhodomonas_salina.1